MCDAVAILKLSLIMLSLGPTFRIGAPTVALDNSEGSASELFVSCLLLLYCLDVPYSLVVTSRVRVDLSALL